MIAGQPKAPRSDAAGSPAAPTAAPKPSTVEPLDAAHARLHLTVSRRLLAKLEAAKEALSHARPGATTEEILEAALDLLLERSAKRKAAATKVPRAARAKQAAVKVPRTPPAKEAAPSDAAIEGDAAGPDQPAGRESRYVPAAVRREVWARDQGRCQWPLESGGICGSRHRLELDHATPVALGGPSTTGNVRVLCERHNKLAARQVFGEAWMARFRRDRTPSLPADHRREERP